MAHQRYVVHPIYGRGVEVAITANLPRNEYIFFVEKNEVMGADLHRSCLPQEFFQQGDAVAIEGSPDPHTFVRASFDKNKASCTPSVGGNFLHDFRKVTFILPDFAANFTLPQEPEDEPLSAEEAHQVETGVNYLLEAMLRLTIILGHREKAQELLTSGPIWEKALQWQLEWRRDVISNSEATPEELATLRTEVSHLEDMVRESPFISYQPMTG